MLRRTPPTTSLGDATSLQGGVLLQTPLLGADEEVYAVAQGSVSIGGFSAGGGGSSVTKNHPTAGRVPEGALVEREIRTTLADADGTLRVNLNSPDFDSATTFFTIPFAVQSRTLRVTPLSSVDA